MAHFKRWVATCGQQLLHGTTQSTSVSTGVLLGTLDREPREPAAHVPHRKAGLHEVPVMVHFMSP